MRSGPQQLGRNVLKVIEPGHTVVIRFDLAMSVGWDKEGI